MLHPRWGYPLAVDVRDLCEAVKLSLRALLTGHRSFLLCAADIASTLSTREAAARFLPGVPIDPAWEKSVGSTASLVDASQARTLLGWQPRHTWASESSLNRVAAAGPSAKDAGVRLALASTIVAGRLSELVETRGLEPLTSAMRTLRSPR